VAKNNILFSQAQTIILENSGKNDKKNSGRAKNGGVLGEEIFCPRADGFSAPPPFGRRGNCFSHEFLIK